MTSKDMINKYKIEIINSEHDLQKFDCGNENLNNFLKENALLQLEQKYNVTYLIIKNEKILGYFSLMADSFKTKNNKQITTKYDFCPAVKIGRLAIDKEFEGRRLGTNILDDITNIVLNYSEYIGIMFITLDAYYTAYPFYLKNAFKFKDVNILEKIKNNAKRNPNIPITMYKDIRRMNN